MKQYFTGFFTAVCLTASAFLFMGAQNKNLGDVTVKSLKVISDQGIPVVLLNSLNDGGAVAVYNSEHKGGCIMTHNDAGGGLIKVFGANREAGVGDGVEITASRYGGLIGIQNLLGTRTCILGTNDNGGGSVQTYNDAGVQTGYFGTNKNRDGTAVLMDRYGEAGWAANGKK